MARLTAAEKRMLDYPPTERTWLCQSKRKTDEGTRICGTPCSGKTEACYSCGKAKPKKPKLLWPQYLLVCKKAGVEPKRKEPA